MAIIFGVDPGSRVAGFGVVEVRNGRLKHLSHGIIVLPAMETFPQKLKILSENLRELFHKYAPHTVVVEKIFLGKNADSAFKLGHARGVVLAEAARMDVVLAEYATRTVKKGITGSGAADKEQVQFVLQKILAIEKIARLDASDALALAVFHAQKFSVSARAVEVNV